MKTREDVLGRTVYASDGEELGNVTAVYDDRDTGKLEWLAVGRSFLGRTAVLVPVVAADIKETGVFLNLPSDKVGDAPEISGESIGQDEERRLYSHYGIDYSQSRSSSGLPKSSSGEKSRSQKGRRSTTQSRSSGNRRRQTRPRGQDQTREELYEEARKLDVEGRSKMSKEQLKRAVSRRRGRSSSRSSSGSASGGRKANPVEVQTFLEGVGYPTGKRELVREAVSQGASSKVRSTLERLPDEKRFQSPAEVSKAIGSRS